MKRSPTTQPSLLVRIRDRSDRASWAQFVELYGPVVYGFLRKRGVQDADAADLMQDVMMDIANAIDRFHYDSAKGCFRNWLLTIVQNRLCNYWRRGQSARGQGGTDAVELLRSHPQPGGEESAEWEKACRRRLFQVAAEQVRGDFQASTWTAFWETAVDGKSPKDVAQKLELSVAAVYMARRRAIKRLKEQIAFLEEDPDALDRPLSRASGTDGTAGRPIT